jgi:CHAT domain-containing protein
MSKSLLITTLLLSSLSSAFAADVSCEIESSIKSIYQAFCDEKIEEAEEKLKQCFSSNNLKRLQKAIFLTQANHQTAINDDRALNILYRLQERLAHALYQEGKLERATEAYRLAKDAVEQLSKGMDEVVDEPSKQAREKVYYGLVDVLLTRAEPERTTDYKERQDLLDEVIETLEVLKQTELQEYFEDDCLISGEERRLDEQLVDESNKDNDKRLSTLSTLQTAILYPILFPNDFNRVVELLFIKFKRVPGKPKIEKEIIWNPAKNSEIATLEVLNEKIRRFRDALLHVVRKPEGGKESNDHRENVKKYGHELYKILIQPMDSELKKIREHNVLVFVPDGVLRTIPLVALSDKQGKFVVDKNYALAIIPGLSLTKSVTEPINRKNPKIFLGGMSEEVCYVFNEAPKIPIKSEEPTKCNAPDFRRLEKTEEALNGIAAIYSGTAPQINEEFVIEKLETEMRSIRPYTMMHLHTHAIFKSGKNNTFLLTYNTQINRKDRLTMARLEDILRLGELRGYPIELLTLSACETAKGDEDSALGLAGVAFKSGARSVLATLWTAEEVVTTSLVEEFYRQLKEKPKQSKAHALQKAQRKMMRMKKTRVQGTEEEKMKPRTKDDKYSYLIAKYWAPFILIGNWF